MTDDPTPASAAVAWAFGNQSRLVAEMENLKTLLQRHASPNTKENPPAPAPPPENQPPSALDNLCAAFSLSPFERSLLLLCAAVELDFSFTSLCAAASGDAGRPYPSFSLALAALPNPHWSALLPEAALRRWRLIETGTGPSLTTAVLRIDERVLHYLAGVWRLDDRLAGVMQPVPPPTESDLAASQALLAADVAHFWSAPSTVRPLPVIQLCSDGPAQCRAVAAAATALLGLRTVVLPADLIPSAVSELDSLLRLWEREAALGGAVLLVEFDTDAGDDGRNRNATRFVERLGIPVIVSTREPQVFRHRTAIAFRVNRPTHAEQRDFWRAALPPGPASDDTPIDALAGQFNLSFPAIRAIAVEALAREELPPAEAAWQACRSRCRPRLDGVAQHIEPAASWDDLVLPEPQIQTLRQLAAQVRHRGRVYQSWGFAAKSGRGLGIGALFTGPSGTGKTMAAEVLAQHLELDLYRIDLASMVSKYIGETEKNLRRVFDAAEDSGSILLFDEADALFGKRSEVKDSHDRYANIEVSYLLQRMEAYRGLAILTTNLKNSLDSAFLRRLRFLVQFPHPDFAQRAEIWRRAFPAATPRENLDFHKLARMNVPGGNIRNIAMNAAFLAADDGQCVRMSHLLTAARAEFGKLERALTESETDGWI
jgi:hypothetical protein